MPAYRRKCVNLDSADGVQSIETKKENVTLYGTKGEMLV